MPLANITTVAGANSLECAPGATATYTFTVKNVSGAKVRMGLDPQAGNNNPAEVEWLEVQDGPALDFKDEEIKQVTIKVSVPQDTAEGSYGFRLRVYDMEHPERIETSSQIDVVVIPVVIIDDDDDEVVTKTCVWCWVVGVCAAIAIVGLLLFWMLLPGKSMVPDVTGKSLAEAQPMLDEAGLVIGTLTEKRSNKPADTILSSDPVADTEVDAGSAVKLVLATQPPANPNKTCFNAVQNKVAWNKQGNKRWSNSNVYNLCKGAETSVEPAVCFKRVMQGGAKRKDGKVWEWRSASALCKGTRNANKTLSCFTRFQRIGAFTYQHAILRCNPNLNGVLPQPAITVGKHQRLLYKLPTTRMTVPQVDESAAQEP
ncbi:MAG: PASTA domain-containing protein [Pseudomonadota bacterium]